MLCFRCEYRAANLEQIAKFGKGLAPRFECGSVETAVHSCYMFRPVCPIALVPNKGDRRPCCAGAVMSARMHMAQNKERMMLTGKEVKVTDGKRTKKGLLIYWRPEKPFKKNDQMKIIKKGKLPPMQAWVGKCSNCGCQFVIHEIEGEWEEDRGNDYLTYPCPTPGCHQKIYMEMPKE